MSLCNTFRLSVVSLIIVLSSIDTPVAFTLRRTRSEPRDLAQEETVVVELINVNGSNVPSSSDSRRSVVQFDEIHINYNKSNDIGQNKYGDDSKNIRQTPNINSVQSPIENISNEKDAITTMQALADRSLGDSLMSNTEHFEENSMSRSKVALDAHLISATEGEMSTDTDGQSTSINSSTNDNQFNSDLTYIGPDTTEVAMITTSEADATEPELPVWKKYTTIDRKRPLITSNEDISNDKTEEMVRAETKRSGVSLEDTVTSDIPSLEQLKNDLLSATFNKTLESKDYVNITSSSEENVTLPIKMKSEWDTIESMRAGYLDLTEKTTLSELFNAKETFDLNISPKEKLQAMFEIGTETDIPEEKNGSTVQSQSQLNEDVIKEELLMEKVLNENEENSKHVDTNISFEHLTSQEQLQSNFSTTDKLNVKPINGEKSKNTTLYTVSPNYKPLKKIEVQPPKPFVRDPDDNSWRNESLSSLGIVFNPKNSSKPFTQVLKNKTETEWNNLSEKDNKNDIPDLRERLQKMAEKRKSKRKKTDSFGNVYFDYEENSNSVENTAKEEIASTTSTPEISSTTLNSSSEEPPTTTPPISTTTNNKSIEIDSYTTKKYKKFFNVPEYYDTAEEDDAEYLNMAKIDIKKFTTLKKTTTQTTSAPTTHTTPTTPTWIIDRTPHTNPPGRKATIQYFPPLTTQKVSINDYDNNFQYRVNSFTETESPKNVLRENPTTTQKVSINDYDNNFQYRVNSFTETESPKNVLRENPTTPENNVIQYKPNINNERFNDYTVTTKPHFDKNVFFTQAPVTTQTGYTLLTEDGAFDRDAYVIRNYKDFINMAAKNNEYERNLDYIPYTQAPMQGVTKADVTYETEKPKLSMDEEYEYESQFRKDVLQRFVDNFNQNTDRFKANFPVLFNNSVIHRNTAGGGDVASSRAFMRGLYNDVKPKHAHRQPCDPNCEKMTVELSPAYELHYYMPDQEEKEEAVSPPPTLPYPYRL